MPKTAEELAARHTRRELEGMAEKLGIEALVIGTKTRLAESILEARKKAEKAGGELPKPRETPDAAAPVKAQPKKPPIGKKGVLAKRATIDAQIKENAVAADMVGAGVKELQKGIKDTRSDMDKNAKDMLQEGTANLQKGINRMHKSIAAQIKENEKASSKMGTGVKEMQKGIKEMQSAIDNKTADIQNGVKEIYSGVKEIQKGIREMEADFRDFRNETANYINDFYYG